LVSRGAKVGIAVVLAAVGVGAVLALSRKAVGVSPVASISLTANVTAGVAPLSVSFTGKAADANGVGVPNAQIYLFVDGVNQNISPPVVTAADGTFSLSAVFTQPGTYSVYVSNSSSGA
jgi:PKD repeat protein